MRTLIIALCTLAAGTTRCWSANDTLFAGNSQVYSGANSGLVYAWSFQPYHTAVQEVSGGVGNGACWHISGTGHDYAIGIGFKFKDGAKNLSQYDHLSIAVKAGTTIHQAVFWLGNSGGGQDPEEFKLPVSIGYSTISIPLGGWTMAERSAAGGIVIAAYPSTQNGSGDYWFDNVILVGNSSSVLPSSSDAVPVVNQNVFPRAGQALVRIFGVNGSLISSRAVSVAANSATDDVIPHYVTAGAHIVTINGAGASVSQKILR